MQSLKHVSIENSSMLFTSKILTHTAEKLMLFLLQELYLYIAFALYLGIIKYTYEYQHRSDCDCLL